MGWRTVIVSSVSKLDYKMNYLVVRSGNTITRIHLSEIAVLIVESTAVSLTAYLLSELEKEKIITVFCDEKRIPQGVYMPLYGSYDTSRKVKIQTGWLQENRNLVWQSIVQRKIAGQSAVLRHFDKQDAGKKLAGYVSQVEPGDVTNREGHAAKVYFNAMFGMGFSRDDKDNIINAELNYGYGILLSVVSREIVNNGYITQVGIHHDNLYNNLNLACDLMEPFRPFVDCLVAKMPHKEFSQTEKQQIVGMLNHKIQQDGREQFVLNAITIYAKSILDSITDGNVSAIKFPDYELSIYESDCVL